MINIFFRLVLVLIAFVLLLAAIGSLLPRAYSFSTEVTTTKAPQDVYPQLSKLSNWQHWSPWTTDNHATNIVHRDEEHVVGSVMTWSDSRGDGKVWLTGAQENESIQYSMVFAGFPEMNSEIKLQPSGQGTKIIWSSEGRLPGGPFYGYFGMFFSNGMKYTYDDSLTKLKKLVEDGAANK